MADGAKERLREEMGPDFDDVDWKKLDPRQYDPRRIIRQALDDNPLSSSTSFATEIPDDTPQTLTGADYAPVVHPAVAPVAKTKVTPPAS
jgi:sec-independent protein translocase protein TatB